MRILLILLMTATPLFSGIKEEIGALQQKIAKYPTGQNHLALALAYLEDQEQEKAFQSFLHALDQAPAQKSPEGEKEVYEEALQLYFAGPEACEKIIKKYEPIALNHPDYTHLNALVAACWANLGNFSKFFKMFYDHYDPTSFLVAKTKAIIELRLAISEKEEQMRTKRKECALTLLTEALEKIDKDPALYRQIIVLAKEKEDNQLIAKCLEKFVASGIKIERGEILFYVTVGCSIDRKDLSQEILRRAKELYTYSRAIEDAEGVLNHAR